MNPGAEHRLLLRRLRQQLRHHGGAGVVYLFSDYALANQWLAAELDAHLRAHARRLLQLEPSAPGLAPADLLALLLAPPAGLPCMPCWLILSDPSISWDEYRDRLLARLNENRAVLEREQAFVFLVLPTRYAARTAEVAPDLWSVRSAVYTVPAWDAGEAQPAAAGAPMAPRLETAGAAPSEALLTRWERQWQGWRSDQGRRLSPALALQLAEQLLEVRLPARALPIAEQALELCRREVAQDGGTPQSLRSLSRALVTMGRVARDMQRLDAAREAFQESLDIARRLASAPDAPIQRLHDLSVSLNGMGRVLRALKQLGEAEAVFRESLEIDRRVAGMDASPSNLQNLSIGLNDFGDIAYDMQQLEVARTAYQESLELRRRLLVLTDKSWASMAGLSTSLVKVGNIAAELGQLEAAREAYTESMGIWRTLVTQADESVPGLRGLSAVSYTHLTLPTTPYV